MLVVMSYIAIYPCFRFSRSYPTILEMFQPYWFDIPLKIVLWLLRLPPTRFGKRPWTINLAFQSPATVPSGSGVKGWLKYRPEGTLNVECCCSSTFTHARVCLLSRRAAVGDCAFATTPVRSANNSPLRRRDNFDDASIAAVVAGDRVLASSTMHSPLPRLARARPATSTSAAGELRRWYGGHGQELHDRHPCPPRAAGQDCQTTTTSHTALFLPPVLASWRCSQSSSALSEPPLLEPPWRLLAMGVKKQLPKQYSPPVRRNVWEGK